ncbi:MAG TPA: transketolase [Vicinamibacterales bacterium]|nr:transketolase [Vicinamibacterales bacterium]
MTVDPGRLRHIILDQSQRAHTGHIGSALSTVDIIAALYDRVLRITAVDDRERDRFVLSKGHAALALYGALFLKGWLTRSELDSFCTDGTRLGVHPDRGLRGIDFSTGSLGQGLSMAVGAALAARLDHSPRRVFVLVSDAECNTGALWESVMFAAHHRLANLVVIVDLNGQQALGYTDHVLNLSPMRDRWQGFGWDVCDIAGHDVEVIAQTIACLNTEIGPPHVVIAHTTFGKGVSFMEGRVEWHYWPMSDEDYRQAVAELDPR